MATQSPLSPGYCHEKEEGGKEGLEKKEEGSSPLHPFLASSLYGGMGLHV
jgi:hypothetical protein